MKIVNIFKYQETSVLESIKNVIINIYILKIITYRETITISTSKLINEIKKELRKERIRGLGEEKKYLTGKQKKMINKAFDDNKAISINLYGELEYGESDFYKTMYVVFAKDCKDSKEMQLEVLKKREEVESLHELVKYI